MSAPIIQAEVENVLRAALRLAIADERISVPVRGFWAANDESDHQQAVTPGVYVLVRPYVPSGADGDGKRYPAGVFAVEVKARWNAADEPGNPVQIGMWRAVEAVVYKAAYTTANGVSVAGTVIGDGATDAGVDDHGAFASVAFSCFVNLDN